MNAAMEMEYLFSPSVSAYIVFASVKIPTIFCASLKGKGTREETTWSEREGSGNNYNFIVNIDPCDPNENLIKRSTSARTGGR